MLPQMDQAERDMLRLNLDPPSTMEMAGIPPDPWQTQMLTDRPKRALLLCCRQAGKSTVTAALSLWTALFEPPALILLVSSSLRQSGELFKKVTWFLGRIPGLPKPVQESALTLELPNGSRIVSLPCSEGTVRGYSGVSLLVVDEAAQVDDDLYRSVRPMLAVSGGRLILLSTPFGKRGFFHEEWTNGTGWTRICIPATQCPRISRAFLAEERAHLGEWWFRQEYLCEFNDMVGQLIREDDIQAMLDPGVKPLFPGGATEYSMVDPTVNRIDMKRFSEEAK